MHTAVLCYTVVYVAIFVLKCFAVGILPGFSQERYIQRIHVLLCDFSMIVAIHSLGKVQHVYPFIRG